MDEKKSPFSEETEKAYKIETESAIVVPEGFKDSVIKKVKVEKMKNRKKLIISIISAAAVIVLAVGVVTVATKTGMFETVKTDGYSCEENQSMSDGSAEPFYGISGCKKVNDDLSSAEIQSSHSHDELLYLQGSTYTEGEESYNWYAFFNAVVDGAIDPRFGEAKGYLIKNRNSFEYMGMSEEEEEANIIIDAVFPFNGFPDAEKAEADMTKHTEIPGLVKSYITMNLFSEEKTGSELNWFEFYNECIAANIDPRFGAASEYLEDANKFFNERKFEEGIEQSELLISASDVINQK